MSERIGQSKKEDGALWSPSAATVPFSCWGISCAFPHSILTRTACARNNAV